MYALAVIPITVVFKVKLGNLNFWISNMLDDELIFANRIGIAGLAIYQIRMFFEVPFQLLDC